MTENRNKSEKQRAGGGDGSVKMGEIARKMAVTR